MKFYSTKEAADFLGISVRTIQNYRKAGILVPDKFGANNSVFYSEEQLIRTIHHLLTKTGTSGELLLYVVISAILCYNTKRIREISL